MMCTIVCHERSIYIQEFRSYDKDGRNISKVLYWNCRSVSLTRLGKIRIRTSFGDMSFVLWRCVLLRHVLLRHVHCKLCFKVGPTVCSRCISLAKFQKFDLENESQGRCQFGSSSTAQSSLSTFNIQHSTPCQNNASRFSLFGIVAKIVNFSKSEIKDE